MLSSKWWNNKASDIKLVYLYSNPIIFCPFYISFISSLGLILQQLSFVLIGPNIFLMNRWMASHPIPHSYQFNPLNVELNPIWNLLALLGAYPTLHVSRIRVKQFSGRSRNIHWNNKFYCRGFGGCGVWRVRKAWRDIWFFFSRTRPTQRHHHLHHHHNHHHHFTCWKIMSTKRKVPSRQLQAATALNHIKDELSGRMVCHP